jgi:hypothetical protein
LRDGLAHILSCRALLTLDEVEFDWFALGERFEPAALDGAVVDEAVLVSAVWRDESESFGVVEPLHLSARAHIPPLRNDRDNTMLCGLTAEPISGAPGELEFQAGPS